MTWAERRRLTYISIILAILIGIGYLLFRQFTNVVPTCSDNRRNGDETGVDCGGGCSLYCANELPSPKVRWVRSFQMTPSVVHAVAYVEHNNATAAARTIGYTFKLYDDKNTLITEKSGTTFLGPLGRTAIAETLIQTGSVPVARTTVTFAEPIVWQKISSALATVVIKTDRTLLEHFTHDGSSKLTSTRLSATIENTSRFTFTNLDAVAVLYDKDDNVVTASKIVVPELAALGEKTVTFTWPFVVSDTVTRTEIITRFNPFTVKAL